MENPLYEVVLGNIPGIRADAHHIGKPEHPHEHVGRKEEPEGTTALIRERQGDVSAARGKEGKKPKVLIVPQINPLDISPKELRKLQRTDPVLGTCFTAVGWKTTS
ncbi:hypothetical protein HPB48_013434 [Haemaphysalis longicornis]|uniref:Uncharacterized protein n=1 Tax=Haemaphysalis longicornis TaxID=44386 RepID=A0A9J6GVF5_HAELO|nr:hypothetical protein HPB48_013434 [Haemaphysalis longicornis]